MSYVSPSEWPTLTLGQLTAETRPICYGVLKPGDYFANGVPLIRITDISKNYFDDSNLHQISCELDQEFSRSKLNGGEILISIQGTIGRVAICPDEYKGANISRTIAVIEPDARIVKQYLYWFLRFYGEKELFDAFGATRASLNISTLRALSVPLPPLPEQKRIAAILDKANQLRQKRQQAIGLADEFLRSVFLDMFGDPEAAGWEFTTVDKLAANYKGSMRTGPFGSQLLHSEFTDSGVAVLGIDNAVKNSFKWAKPRFVSAEKYQELKRYTVKPEDVLITIMGTCGRCAVVPDDIPTAINTKHLCAITLDKDMCTPRFLHSYFLMHPTARKYLSRKAKGAIMDGLNMGTIKELPVPIVPIQLQKKYQAICEKYDQTLERLYLSESVNNEIFNALSQKAFAGEL